MKIDEIKFLPNEKRRIYYLSMIFLLYTIDSDELRNLKSIMVDKIIENHLNLEEKDKEYRGLFKYWKFVKQLKNMNRQELELLYVILNVVATGGNEGEFTVSYNEAMYIKGVLVTSDKFTEEEVTFYHQALFSTD